MKMTKDKTVGGLFISDTDRLNLMLSGELVVRDLENGMTEVHHGPTNGWWRRRDPRKAIDCAFYAMRSRMPRKTRRKEEYER